MHDLIRCVGLRFSSLLNGILEEFMELLVPSPFTSQGLFVINIWLKSRP